MKRRVWVLTGLVAAMVIVRIPSTTAQSVIYHPIPPGFDFPGDQATLLKMRDTGDIAGMRKHVWMVFAGFTQPTETGEAIWETWYSADATFNPGPGLQGAHKVQRKFQVPRQFMTHGAHPQAIGASLLSFTLFNQETRAQVRTNQLNSADHLTAINNSFSDSTPVADRNISAFPNAAMSLKTVWWVVKKNGLTALPVFDPDSNPLVPAATIIRHGSAWLLSTPRA